jgi:hypothetical protein
LNVSSATMSGLAAARARSLQRAKSSRKTKPHPDRDFVP